MQEYRYSARFYDGLFSPFMQPIRQKVLDLVQKYRYGNILDVCCGTGDQLKVLKQHGYHNAVGVDLSDAMLEVARKGAYPADCIRHDATQMPYEDAHFDLVMTAFALHEKEHDTARNILEEMYRLTADGGDMLIIDYALSTKSSRIAKILITLIERLAGREHYRHFRAYHQRGGLPVLLEGFSLQEVERHYFSQHSVILLLLRKTGHS